MFKLPSKADPAFAPGARNRYDDFVAVHINQTLSIHGTVSTSHRAMVMPSPAYESLTEFQGNFLTWHRYYTWAFETALREERGYKSY